jgi:hypothetical protein
LATKQVAQTSWTIECCFLAILSSEGVGASIKVSPTRHLGTSMPSQDESLPDQMPHGSLDQPKVQHCQRPRPRVQLFFSRQKADLGRSVKARRVVQIDAKPMNSVVNPKGCMLLLW